MSQWHEAMRQRCDDNRRSASLPPPARPHAGGDQDDCRGRGPWARASHGSLSVGMGFVHKLSGLVDQRAQCLEAGAGQAWEGVEGVEGSTSLDGERCRHRSHQGGLNGVVGL